MVWQRRYWEHTIWDEDDLQRHVDYLHFNPVKHGWVQRVVDWPHSSFHRYVRYGLLSANWGSGDLDEMELGEPERYLHRAPLHQGYSTYSGCLMAFARSEDRAAIWGIMNLFVQRASPVPSRATHYH